MCLSGSGSPSLCCYSFTYTMSPTCPEGFLLLSQHPGLTTLPSPSFPGTLQDPLDLFHGTWISHCSPVFFLIFAVRVPQERERSSRKDFFGRTLVKGLLTGVRAGSDCQPGRWHLRNRNHSVFQGFGTMCLHLGGQENQEVWPCHRPEVGTLTGDGAR